MAKATDAELQRWRELEAEVVLNALAEFAKRDPTFRPIKDQATVRWHASARHRDFELLLTGPRFFDSRAAKGGGGAIDLAMHLLQTTFVDAVKALRAAGI